MKETLRKQKQKRCRTMKQHVKEVYSGFACEISRTRAVQLWRYENDKIKSIDTWNDWQGPGPQPEFVKAQQELDMLTSFIRSVAGQ